MADASSPGRIDGDVLRWMPLTARRVLDLGADDGALAAAYRMRNPSVDYVGLHSLQDGDARSLLARIEHRLRSLGPDGPPFDLVVLNDVLECVPEPQALLDRLRALVSHSATVIVRFENAAQGQAVASLLAGRWPWAADGPFDAARLRPATLQSMQTLLGDAGFRLERARSQPASAAATDQPWAPLTDAAVKLGHKGEDIERRLTTKSYVATARRADHIPEPRLHVHLAAFAPAFLDVRTVQPLAALEGDASLTLSHAVKSSALPMLGVEVPKIAVLQRLVVRDAAGWISYVRNAAARGWLLVYEIDDHPDLISRVQQNDHLGGLIRGLVASTCHAVQTSTEALAEVLRASNPETAVFENALLELPPWRPRDGVTRVFYGALNREGFSGAVAASLSPAIEACPQLQFEVMHDRAFFDALPTVNKVFHKASPYERYLEVMGSCDVVLSPLEGRGGEPFKSDIKFLEATRAGAAMIASPSVYKRTIQDGVTGLIARELGDWSRTLIQLSKEPRRRDDLAKAAWAYVRDHRMMARQAAARAAWYRQLYARRAELDARVARLCADVQA